MRKEAKDIEDMVESKGQEDQKEKLAYLDSGVRQEEMAQKDAR